MFELISAGAAATLRTAIILVVAILAVPSGAYASVIYDLTLTATYDSSGAPLSTFSGTGTITLPSAPSATGLTAPISAPVTFTIDGESFSGTANFVEFYNGAFYNATFAGSIAGPPRFALDTSGVFAFYYDNELQDASGTIAETADPSPTPLPAALPLFAGGLGIIGLVSRRRKRKSAGLATA